MNPEKKALLQAINLLEAQRAILGDVAVEGVLIGLRQNLAKLEAAEVAPPSNKAISMEGERKLVTVMFADFSNFTAMSERMDAEEVRAIMNGCFSKLVPIVEHYGGMVDKFIGDEIMALFGAPHAHDNDAEYALRAALDMMKALEEFHTQHQTNLGLHFGINTGVVVTGGVSSTERQQYSVIGDPVNLAARLEDAPVTGEILVGHDTYRLTAPLFDFEERDPISVKGKSKPVPLYRLLGLKATPESARGVAGLSSQMVGRDEPFQAFQMAIENLKSNQGSAVALIAEPGLGKSRMLNELQKAAEYVHWIEGRGQSFAQNISYGLAKSVLDSALEIAPNAPIHEVGQKLWQRLNEWDAGRANELYPYLARLRGVSLDEETDLLLRAVSPEAMQFRMRQAFGEFILLRSYQQPTALVWEDLHWADASSLQLIEYLFQIVHNQPLLLLLSFRPQEGLVHEYQRHWVDSIPDYKAITLAPLTEAESKLLVENLLRIKNLPEKTREIILQKAEGNPFYLEELLRSLLDTGLLFWQEGQIHLKQEIEQLHIPNTLQGVIEARIDRLHSEEKITLQTASVIGRLFGKQVLEYLIEQEKRVIALNPTLRTLQDRELIRQRMLYEYIFKHAVTHDVTYNILLMARRRELHQYAGEALESLFPTQTEELAAALAWHYQRARNHEKAIFYLVLAADKSRLTFSFYEAELYYREALKELEQIRDVEWKQKAKICEHLGDVLVSLSQFNEARQAYLEAKATVPEREIIVQAGLFRKMGESYFPQRRPDQELIQFDLAVETLGQYNTERSPSWWQEWLEIQLARVWSLYWLNRVAEMKQSLEAIQSICEESGTIRQQSLWYNRWMLVIFRTERYDITLSQVQYAEKALALSYQAQDYQLITNHAALLGMAYLFANELKQAEKQLLTAIELSQKVGNRQHEIVSLQFLNLTYVLDGNTEGAQKRTPIMEERATGKLPFYLFVVRGLYGWLAWKEGDLAEAEKQALEGLKIHNQASIPNSLLKWVLVATYVTQHRYTAAIPHVKDLLLPYQYKIPNEVESVMLMAIAYWESGQIKQAETELNRLIELAQTYHNF